MFRTFLVAIALVQLALPLHAAEIDSKYLSDDAHLVVTINVRKTLETPAYKKQFAQPAEALLKMEIVQAILKDAGFDPVNDIHRITIAADSLAAKAEPLFLIEGRFDAAKLEAKAKQLFKDMKIHDAGMHKVYELSGEALTRFDLARYVAIIDGHTVAICRSRERVTEVLDKAAGKRKTQFQDKNLAGALKKLDADQVINLAATGELIGARGDTLKDGPGIEALAVCLRVADDIKGEATVVAADAAKAKAVADAIQEGFQSAIAEVKGEIERPKPRFPAQLMAPFLNVLNAIKVGTQENTVVIKGATSAETGLRLVQSFVTLAKQNFKSVVPDVDD